MIEKVRETASRHAMFTSGRSVLVAVSGGPDSVALLHALNTLRDEFGLSLAAAHLDHGFRGMESAGDADYVRDLCEQLDVPVHAAFIDVPALKKQSHLSSQEAARKARHAFLRQAAAEVGAERIALGHTRDDRVETILLNLLRGTGMEGLSGFPPVSLPLVRPLYNVSRLEVLDYCAEHDLRPRTDSSNAKLDYRRNRIRTELLPHLAAHYNERVDEALLRMAELVSADNILLEELAEEALARIIIELSSLQIVLNAQGLNAYPVALRRRIVRRAIARLRGSLHDIRFEMVETVLSACESSEKVVLDLPACQAGRFGVQTTGTALIIFQRREPVEASEWRVALQIPGKTAMPHSGFVVESVICEHYQHARDQIRQQREARQDTGEEAVVLLFPLSEIQLPLIARSWRAGDRMRPRGMRGRKKLQDIFTDRKIAREQRACLPVIVEAGAAAQESADSPEKGRILAILGVQTSDAALPLTGDAAEPEKNGPFLLLMALSDGVVS